jgi:glucose-1-phosphatase
VIKAIIVDVGGVILHERDHAKRFEWEARLGLPKGELDRIVFDSAPAAHAASGQVQASEVWREVGGVLGLTATQIAELQYDYWSCEVLDSALVSFLQGLRPRYRISILTNAWSDARTIHNSRFKFDSWLDGAIYSAEVRLLKPDPRIYRLALDQLGLAAHACIYVDDKSTNVEAAESLGMFGVCYRNTEQTIADIQELLANQSINR